MNLDLDKPTIMQLKTMVNAINREFHNRKMENNLPTFPQLNLKHIGKRKYTLNADKYDGKTFKVIKTKELTEGSIFIITNYIFDKFYTTKEVA